MKTKILFTLSFLFGALFINAGLNKFFNYMPMPPDLSEEMVKLNTSFVEMGWFLPLVAVVEIIGGLLFIISKTRALGAIIIFPIMVGILLTHLFQDRSGLLIASILFCINLWVILENKEKYEHMIES